MKYWQSGRYSLHWANYTGYIFSNGPLFSIPSIHWPSGRSVSEQLGPWGEPRHGLMLPSRERGATTIMVVEPPSAPAGGVANTLLRVRRVLGGGVFTRVLGDYEIRGWGSRLGGRGFSFLVFLGVLKMLRH